MGNHRRITIIITVIITVVMTVAEPGGLIRG
jgi:hypothetical protein